MVMIMCHQNPMSYAKSGNMHGNMVMIMCGLNPMSYANSPWEHALQHGYDHVSSESNIIC